MKMSKFARTTLIGVATTLALSGAAFAATSADISDTGPGSSNEINISTSNHIDVVNNNNVTIDNTNTQTASTGDAKVADNTTAGDATVGAATNDNTVKTDVSIDNQAPCCVGGQGGDGQGSGDGGLGGGGGQPSAVGGGGGGLGAGSLSTSSATLPKTGPSGVIDVSALRNLLSHGAGQVISAAGNTSSLPMILAVLLSLIGAIGAGFVSFRRTLRV